MEKKIFTTAFIVAVSILIILFLLTQVSVNDIVSTFFSINPLVLIVCFILYSILYLVRAVRFSVMLKTRGSIADFFRIVCIHNMANVVLPFKTGELAFVFLAKERQQVSLSMGVVTVAIARIYDALSICLIFLAMVAIYDDRTGLLGTVTTSIMIIAVLLIIFMIALLWMGGVMRSVILRLSACKLLNRPSLQTLFSRAEYVLQHYSSAESRRNFFPLLLMSVLIWTLSVSMSFLLVSAMGLGLSMPAIVIGLLLSSISASLPIHGIGNFGTAELLWAGIFIMLGATKAVAISSGFAFHILIITFTIILWLFAMISYKLSTIKSGEAV